MKAETKKIIARFPNLKDGVKIGVDATTPQGDRVEIRKDGSLCWRAFEWESDFEYNLEKQLECVSK